MGPEELTAAAAVNVGLNYGDYVDAQFLRLAWEERLTTPLQSFAILSISTRTVWPLRRGALRRGAEYPA